MIKAKLIIVGGDAKRSEINLKKLPATIGRANEASITLPHALVSRQHCEIYEQDKRLYVKDLNSLNGTYLNNEKISGSTSLLPGQLLTLGNVTFRADYSVPEGSLEKSSTPEPHIVVETKSENPQQSDIDTDHGGPSPGSDTDEHMFDLHVDSADSDKANKSISMGAIGDLPSQQPQASFQGKLLQVEEEPAVQVSSDEIKIDLGDEKTGDNKASQSSLDDFFRKMPR